MGTLAGEGVVAAEFSPVLHPAAPTRPSSRHALRQSPTPSHAPSTPRTSAAFGLGEIEGCNTAKAYRVVRRRARLLRCKMRLLKRTRKLAVSTNYDNWR